MDTVHINKGKARMIAHRGLSGIEKENTCSAFVAAGNRSYFGIEADVYSTSDGRFVICHDHDLLRIAGVDLQVESSTLEELQSVVLFDRDGKKSRTDLRLCTLENYIEICKKYEKHCVLELKSQFTDVEIADIINTLESFSYLESTTFISFDRNNLLRVRKILPNHPVQYLFMEASEEILARLIEDKMDADVLYRAASRELVERLHAAELKINCWTVDDPIEAEKLIEWGVDYITSNILE